MKISITMMSSTIISYVLDDNINDLNDNINVNGISVNDSINNHDELKDNIVHHDELSDNINDLNDKLNSRVYRSMIRYSYRGCSCWCC